MAAQESANPFEEGIQTSGDGNPFVASEDKAEPRLCCRPDCEKPAYKTEQYCSRKCQSIHTGLHRQGSKISTVDPSVMGATTTTDSQAPKASKSGKTKRKNDSQIGDENSQGQNASPLSAKLAEGLELPSPFMDGSKVDLQKELDGARFLLDESRKQSEQLQRQLTQGEGPPSTSFAVAACDFKPNQTDIENAGLTVPGDQVMLQVAAGETLEVVTRHLTGWVRARRPAGLGEGTAEGWVPDGVLRAIGEVGRGIASRDCNPEEDCSGPQGEAGNSLRLTVPQGALLKLLERDGDWWLVEADGCRGFVPVDAVREAAPDEESGMKALGMTMQRGRTITEMEVPPEMDMAQEMSAKVTSRVSTRSRASGRAKKGDVSTLLGDIESAKPKEATKPIKEEKTEKDKNREWTFGLWAYQASFYAIAMCSITGIAGFFWSLRHKDDYPAGLKSYAEDYRHFSAAIYSVVLAVVWLIFNTKSKLASSSGTLPAGTPLRGLLCFVLSAPLMMSGVTMLAGVNVCFIGVLFFISAMRHEKGGRPENAKAFYMKEQDEELQGVSKCSPKWFKIWWEIQGITGERPKFVIIFIWLVANGVLCGLKYYWTRQFLLDPPADLVEAITKRCWTADSIHARENCIELLDAYQTWIPVAKLFGQGLNLNCMLIILPICQHFVVKVNTLAITDPGWKGKFCRFLPTQKNLVFHKSLAAVIAVYSFCHAFAHYMAHSYTLTTFERLHGRTGVAITLSVWATGALPLMVITLMFPVSRDYIKRTQFEVFYYTHIIGATIFMLCLLYHGPVFYLFACIPLCLYLVDRYMRSQLVTLAPAKLLQIRWKPPVMQLTFEAPWKYISGQYVTITCPKITGYKKYESHPFTICSSPEPGLLSVAIKCWPGGWTAKLRDFLAAVVEEDEEDDAVAEGAAKGLIATGQYTFEKVDFLTGKIIRGKTYYRDGAPLVKIEGPHAAPAMRYAEFEVVILAVAGIGLTPASSILRSLLQYKWRSDPQAGPRNVYFVWLVAHAEVPAYEWFTEEMAALEVAASANKSYNGAVGRSFEAQVFVTRAPGKDAVETHMPTAKPAVMHMKNKNGAVEQYTVPGVEQAYESMQLIDWLLHPGTKPDDKMETDKLEWQEIGEPEYTTSMDKMLENKRKTGEKLKNQVGHTSVWKGRPEWKAFFKNVKENHRGKDKKVGVFFCGAPAIGKDLKKQCHQFSDKEISFLIHKESF